MAEKKSRLGQDPLNWIKDSREDAPVSEGDAADKAKSGKVKKAPVKRAAAKAGGDNAGAPSVADYEALAARVAELEKAIQTASAEKDARVRQLEGELEDMRGELNRLRYPWMDWWRLWWGR